MREEEGMLEICAVLIGEKETTIPLMNIIQLDATAVEGVGKSVSEACRSLVL